MENGLLKRAVAIQAKKLQAATDDAARARAAAARAAERLRQAERTNYALSVHLQHSSPATGGGGFGPRSPDVC